MVILQRGNVIVPVEVETVDEAQSTPYRSAVALPQSQLGLGVDLIDVVVARVVQVVADARYQQNEDVHVAQTRNQICLPSDCIHLAGGHENKCQK